VIGRTAPTRRSPGRFSTVPPERPDFAGVARFVETGEDIWQFSFGWLARSPAERAFALTAYV
jgi:hypothetical protein